MGQVYHVLAQLEGHPEQWPYHGRIVIEDCETVHIHVNNVRLEFYRDQFLQLVDLMTYAGETLRQIMENTTKVNE